MVFLVFSSSADKSTHCNNGHTLFQSSAGLMLFIGHRSRLRKKKRKIWPWGKKMISPRKIHMEPKSRPIEKENHLKTIIFRFHVNLPGCCSSPFGPIIYGSWERPAPDPFTILCLDPLKKISMDTLIIHSLIWISRKLWRDLEKTENLSILEDHI